MNILYGTLKWEKMFCHLFYFVVLGYTRNYMFFLFPEEGLNDANMNCAKRQD